MRFKNLHISGFRSINSPQEIILDRPPGLYLLTGRNETDPGLGSNGAGKSTVWDALCWVMYGRTARALKAPTLKSWYGHSAPCEVDLTFSDDGHEYHLIRTHKPNFCGLVKDAGELEVVTQDQLDAIFGLNFEPFLHTIMIAQFHQLFFDLGPSDKAHLFSAVLNLDRWLTYSSASRERAKEHKQLVSQAEAKIDALNRILARTRESFEDSQRSSQEWEEAEKRRQSRLSDQLEHLEAELNQAETDLNGSSAQLTAFEAQSDQAEQFFNSARNMVDQHRNLLEESRLQLQRIEMLQEQTTERFVQITSLGPECTVCGQAVPPSHVQQERSKLQLQLDDIKNRQQVRRKGRDLSAQELEVAKQVVNEKAGALKQARNAVSEYKIGHAVLLTRHNNLQESLDNTQASISSSIEQQNPYLKQLNTLIGSIREYETELDTRTEQRTQAQADAAAYTYWVDGFRSIRLSLLESGVQQFEAELLAAMSGCGLSEWGVECTIDPDRVGKSARNGFQITFLPPHKTADRSMPWEAWSGGESQLLRLCGTFALSNLVMSLSGATSNIEVYDEPSKSVSEEGVDALMERLADRAHEQDRTIFVADHRSMNTRHFAGIIEVVKTAQGSVITQD